MQRIILHHTAGSLVPSAFDKRHYHRLIDGEGKVHSGLHPISANAPGKAMRSGQYAAHTAGLNTGSIGVSMACMANAQWSDPGGCKTFPRPAQVEAMIAEVARLCIDYSIPVARQTVLSHAEVQISLGVTQAGKWDFDYDPFGAMDSRDPIRIGDMLRDRIASVIRATGQDEPAALRGPMPVLRRGARGDAVRTLQSALGLTADGIFGPATQTAVLAFQRRNQLLPDGVVGKATWAALNIQQGD